MSDTLRRSLTTHTASVPNFLSTCLCRHPERRRGSASHWQVATRNSCAAKPDGRHPGAGGLLAVHGPTGGHVGRCAGRSGC